MVEVVRGETCIKRSGNLGKSGGDIIALVVMAEVEVDEKSAESLMQSPGVIRVAC